MQILYKTVPNCFSLELLQNSILPVPPIVIFDRGQHIGVIDEKKDNGTIITIECNQFFNDKQKGKNNYGRYSEIAFSSGSTKKTM